MTHSTESQIPNSPPPQSEKDNRPAIGFFTRMFASGLFSGYSPVASGTAGSAVGLAAYAIPGFENPAIVVPLCIVVYVLGVRAAASMERVYGQDPGEVTIDEVLGMWISLIMLPKSLLISGVAFVLFRIFDIVKPYPARRFDSMLGGHGIMLDDVVCGIYTNLILQTALALGVF